MANSTYLFWSDTIQPLTPEAHWFWVKILLGETEGILGPGPMKQGCGEGKGRETNETLFAILLSGLVAATSPCWFWRKESSYWWQHLAMPSRRPFRSTLESRLQVELMAVTRTFSADASSLKMSEFCAGTHKRYVHKWSYIIRTWTCIIISMCN